MKADVHDRLRRAYLESALEECINQLSSANAKLLESRYAEGHSVQEIAQNMSRPVASGAQGPLRRPSM